MLGVSVPTLTPRGREDALCASSSNGFREPWKRASSNELRLLPSSKEGVRGARVVPGREGVCQLASERLRSERPCRKAEGRLTLRYTLAG